MRKLQCFTSEIFETCRFSCSLCSIFESFCDQEGSKHSKTLKLAVQYAILQRERVAVFSFKCTSKVALILQRFLWKVPNFLRSFHRWKKKNPPKRTNALFSRFFAGEFQFHVRKEPQNDPKKSRKKFWQLFDKLVIFY